VTVYALFNVYARLLKLFVISARTLYAVATDPSLGTLAYTTFPKAISLTQATKHDSNRSHVGETAEGIRHNGFCSFIDPLHLAIDGLRYGAIVSLRDHLGKFFICDELVEKDLDSEQFRCLRWGKTGGQEKNQRE